MGNLWKRQRSWQNIPIDRSQAKCLADVVLLYLRYAANAIPIHQETLEYAETIYREFIRGEVIQNPRMTAASIIYLAIVMCEESRTQADVSEALRINENSLRLNYKQLKKDLSKHNTRLFELALWGNNKNKDVVAEAAIGEEA